MLEAVLRSLLPLAVSREIATESEAETLLAQLRHDAETDRPSVRSCGRCSWAPGDASA